jgi:predicted metal-binding membrane protein
VIAREASVRRGRRPSGPIVLVLGIIAAGWALSIAAEASGAAAQLHHHALYHSDLAQWQSTLLVIASWQTMTAAMMLPSSLPFALLFLRASRNAPRRHLAAGLFLGAYFAVWTTFAVVAFNLDILLHQTVHSSQWLLAHDQVVAAGTLALAAGYQVSPLKYACLRACRNPGAYLLRHYRRGSVAAARIGLEHGLFCLGCCWALMLVMFAVGIAHLAWMGVIAVVMVAEKVAPWGERIVVPVAVVLGGLAVMALAVPGSVPGM